jgi:hypothetical protein
VLDGGGWGADAVSARWVVSSPPTSRKRSEKWGTHILFIPVVRAIFRFNTPVIFKPSVFTFTYLFFFA